MRQLIEAGWEIVALARHQVADAIPGVIRVSADIAGESWPRWCEGCSAAIHLVGIIKEVPRERVTFDRLHRVATERVVTACKQLGIGRIIHMSALGAREGAVTAYHRTKWFGEEVVRASGLAWTIFRPSVIFGPGDGFTTSLASALARAPMFPVFGDGNVRLQPIAMDEVAKAFVTSLELPASEGRVIELGGPEALTYNEVLRRTASALGRSPALLHLPLGVSRLAVRIAQHLPGAPITMDQLTMLLEGSVCDTAVAKELFGIPVTAFAGPTWMKR